MKSPQPSPSEAGTGGFGGGGFAGGGAGSGGLADAALGSILGPNLFSIILYKLFKNLQDFFTMPFQSLGDGPLIG